MPRIELCHETAKTVKNRKGTKKALQDVRGTQREMRILRKLREF